ncbi:hypothetical protein GA707_05090 [Nostocoides sp. F2B08]|uniref:nucleotidyltransferase domain-containing protein n=1 Tax=Nostocoides sp. F2B08 TaxID=2653936 RepID=UPI001263834B|nr:DUF6036 family nucleotidyltransferase [Tetrasphaera sp. F2B08]KAB7745313.1 hypothetical protein GA707_05090 [Tetrasphaera sp. F2B08]
MPLLQDVAAALEEAGVAYVVAGGVAVVLHGHVRTTVDLDIALDLRRENVERALEVLGGLGLRPRLPVPASDFADEEVRESWVRDRNLIAFTMHDPSDARREVDLFAHPPIAFEDLWRESVVVDVAGLAVRVVSLNHLVAMKRIAGREQDRADIAALQRIHPGLRLDRS